MAMATQLVRRPRPRATGGVVLYDQYGQAFDASATLSAWKGSTNDRRTRTWDATGASINALLVGEVNEMRRRTRDLLRKNPWASNGIEAWVSNLVGNGLVPHPAITDAKLRETVMLAWEEFAENSDADGTQDFYGQQAVVAHAFKTGGDCFVRFRPRRSNELPIPLQLQALEAELVDPTFNETLPGGGKIHGGIEFDVLGKRIAYHMWQEHPGELVSLRNATRVRVPAESVMHVFHPTRPGQIRGIPVLAAVLAKLWELEKYDDAEVVRKQVAAMFAAFISKPDANSDPLGTGLPGTPTEGRDHDGTPLARLEPGTVQELGPGEGVTFSDPSDVGASYAPFMRFQLRQVAAAIGVTYEQMTGDLENVNYSSIRAGLVEMRRRFAQVQRNVLVFQFCRRVWRRFVETAVLAGRIPVPDDFRKLLRVHWVMTPGWEYIDPEKEINATLKKIRGGLTTRDREVTALGSDVVALDEEAARGNERMDRLLLVYDSDPRRTSAQGQPLLAAQGGAAPPAGEREGSDEKPGDEEREADDEPRREQEPAEEPEARVHGEAKATSEGTKPRRKRTARRAAADAEVRNDGPDLPSGARARRRPAEAASAVRHLRRSEREPGGQRRDRRHPSRR